LCDEPFLLCTMYTRNTAWDEFGLGYGGAFMAYTSGDLGIWHDLCGDDELVCFAVSSHGRTSVYLAYCIFIRRCCHFLPLRSLLTLGNVFFPPPLFFSLGGRKQV
jgi:hypothetical protein